MPAERSGRLSRLGHIALVSSLGVAFTSRTSGDSETPLRTATTSGGSESRSGRLSAEHPEELQRVKAGHRSRCIEDVASHCVVRERNRARRLLSAHQRRMWLYKPMDEATDAASPAQTREMMTRLSARGYVQLRHILVQLPDADKVRTSTVGRAVAERRHRALLLYLLLLTCWPWLQDNDAPLSSAVWIRALTPPPGGGLTWSPSTLSRAWLDLEDLGLLEPRVRHGRATTIVPRREDGGAAYDAPGGRIDRWNTYFSLPDAFWTADIFAKLSLPGLAMLLIIAKETSSKSEMYLPYSKARDWYGISPKSAQNGIANLESNGLLHRREEKIVAPLSPTGVSVRTWYSLTGDFGHEARRAQGARASKERKARLQRKKPKFKAEKS